MFLEEDEQRAERKSPFNMLPHSQRINTSLFKEIMEKGRFSHGNLFLFRFVKYEGKSRLSVSVSKKVAKSAVDRNKIKRRVYSLLRGMIDKIKPGYKVIVFVKTNIDKVNFDQLNKDLYSDFVKSGLLK